MWRDPLVRSSADKMEHWTLCGSEVVVATRWLTIERNRYLRDGREIRDYHVLRRSPFVVIVAVTKDDDVLLVREYRAATAKIYLAFPAGYIDPGEDPDEAAERELREETGAIGCDWRRVGQLDPLPGYIDSPAHIFRCEVVEVDSDARVPEEGAAHHLEVIRMQRSDVREAIIRGEISEMQAASAFLLADAVEKRTDRHSTD